MNRGRTSVPSVSSCSIPGDNIYSRRGGGSRLSFWPERGGPYPGGRVETEGNRENGERPKTRMHRLCRKAVGHSCLN